MPGGQNNGGAEAKLRALLVDADQALAQQVAAALRADGFYASEVRSGERALAELASEPFDVCVLNLQLPDHNALDLIAKTRVISPPPALVVTSAVEQPGLCASCLRAGADDYCAKPIAPEDLFERVRRVAHRRRSRLELERRLSARENPAQLWTDSPRIHISALFSDVRGFTTLSEESDPETAVTLLNGLFAELVKAVEHYQGYVDNFMGDGMMAIFSDGADGEKRARRANGHPLCALMAAHRMQHQLREFHETSPLAAKHELTIGIGIHSGRAVCGPVGAGALRKVTAIGDSVNIASRLCDLARGEGIMISDATYRYTEQHVEIEDSWEVVLRGKRESHVVHSVHLRG